MSIWRLIVSVFLSIPITQAIGLLVGGLVDDGGTGPFAILALPMTLLFFGLPAFVPCAVIIAGTFYGLMAAGHPRLTPIFLAVFGGAWIAYMVVVNPTPGGAMPGYDEILQLNVAAVLIVWAAYAHWQLGFKSDRVRQVLKP